MTLSIEEINKLEKDNERLRQEVIQWQHEYEMLDACIEIYKLGFKMFKRNFKEIRRIIRSNKMPSLPLAGVNAILDVIDRSIGTEK